MGNLLNDTYKDDRQATLMLSTNLLDMVFAGTNLPLTTTF